MDNWGDGEKRNVAGSSGRSYEVHHVGGVFSCNCPAWRNQSRPAHQRTCKHIISLRGAALEEQRVGAPVAPLPRTSSSEGKVPPLLLAHSWDQLTDLTGWWLSEKLDGVRAYWDGQQLISRLGNAFVAPDWFLEGLPHHPLDGELWVDRGLFQRTVSIVRRQDAGQDWRQIRYLVFDAPASCAPFEERQQQCRASLERAGAHVQLLAQEVCQGLDHLRARLSEVEAQKGEGLMLRSPGSLYQVGRSSTLLKVKSFHDAEATVVGYQAGEGRHKGRVGALQVELANGTRFFVGTGLSDAEREQPPALGSQITFRYQELTDAGVPRFPSFLRVRSDLPKFQALPKASDPTHQDNFRRFEYSQGGSQKFWEVALEGTSQMVRYGRIGTAGQSKNKVFASAAEAERETQKLITEKLAKGYSAV